MAKAPKTHRQKVVEGMRRAAAMGRPAGRPVTVSDDEIRAVIALGTARGAAVVRLSKRQFIERRRRLEAQEAATP